jgi:hypothetical protein
MLSSNLLLSVPHLTWEGVRQRKNASMFSRPIRQASRMISSRCSVVELELGP